MVAKIRGDYPKFSVKKHPKGAIAARPVFRKTSRNILPPFQSSQVKNPRLAHADYPAA